MFRPPEPLTARPVRARRRVYLFHRVPDQTRRMPMRRCGFAVLCSLAMLVTLAALPAFAQITAATMSGTVRDQTGGVLPGVNVTIKNAETGLSRAVETDGNGLFTVAGLRPGTYDVRAELQGFTTET